MARLAVEEIAAFGLTASQAEAFRQICQRRVVPVWGPPGTGKTHFLAAAILALAAAHARAGRPFRVLVTAFTHAAIENLLRKIAAAPRVLPAGQSAARSARPRAGRARKRRASRPWTESRLGAWLQEHRRRSSGRRSIRVEEIRPDAAVRSGRDRRGVPGARARSGRADRTGRSARAAGAGGRSSAVAADRGRRLSRNANPASRCCTARSSRRRTAFRLADRHGAEPLVCAAVSATAAAADRRSPELEETCGHGFRRVGRPSPSELQSRVVQQLTENFRMNDVLTSFCRRTAVRPRLSQLRSRPWPSGV